MKDLIRKILNEEFLNEKFKVGSEEYIKLLDTDKFLLIIPLTHGASCKYGATTKWCTTSKEDVKKFEDHINLGVLAYLIIKDNEIIQKLKNAKFALYRLFTDGPGRTIVFDELNNEYRNGEQWLSNEFDKVDELFNYYKIMKVFNQYFEENKE